MEGILDYYLKNNNISEKSFNVTKLSDNIFKAGYKKKDNDSKDGKKINQTKEKVENIDKKREIYFNSYYT